MTAGAPGSAGGEAAWGAALATLAANVAVVEAMLLGGRAVPLVAVDTATLPGSLPVALEAQARALLARLAVIDDVAAAVRARRLGAPRARPSAGPPAPGGRVLDMTV